MTDAKQPRIGRPPKTDADGVATRERLLRAAVDACIEYGFANVTLADVARRADVSTPAIYNHFANKDELLVEACRSELYGGPRMHQPRPFDLRRAARAYLRPELAAARRLQLELHLASQDSPAVAELLGQWHRDRAEQWLEDGAGSLADVKASYLFLLGLAHLESLSALEVSDTKLRAAVDRMIVGLLDEQA
ncbi:MAG: TetR/AcrR family transcriptional regulator [Acidimicrobiales bacterium]